MRFEPSAYESNLSISTDEELRTFYENVVLVLCRVPLVEVQRVEWEQLEQVVDEYLSEFIISLIFEPSYEPMEIGGFNWNGEWLCMPSYVEITDTGMAIPSISTAEFCDAADLCISGELTHMAAIVATLCRPAAESYDFDRAVARAKTMDQLPMYSVWELFFCLHEYTRA